MKKKIFSLFLATLFSVGLNFNSFSQASVDPDDDCLYLSFIPLLDNPGACSGEGPGCLVIIC